jgi:hypothetical protein
VLPEIANPVTNDRESAIFRVLVTGLAARIERSHVPDRMARPLRRRLVKLVDAALAHTP